MDRLARQITVAGMVTCSSYVLFSGMSGQQMGVIPLINNRFGPFNATVEQKVKGWNAYFPTAMVRPVSKLIMAGRHSHRIRVVVPCHR
jgi:hypothetical protein